MSVRMPKGKAIIRTRSRPSTPATDRKNAMNCVEDAIYFERHPEIQKELRRIMRKMGRTEFEQKESGHE